jgi:hypothetical protein
MIRLDPDPRVAALVKFQGYHRPSLKTAERIGAADELL